jgi:hypothetical protein
MDSLFKVDPDDHSLPTQISREPKRPEARYETTHWAAYNLALKARGSLRI